MVATTNTNHSPEAPMTHTTTVTLTYRQLGRQRVADHKWTCSCGDFGKAANGFSSDREARVDALGHQPQNAWRRG